MFPVLSVRSTVACVEGRERERECVCSSSLANLATTNSSRYSFYGVGFFFQGNRHTNVLSPEIVTSLKQVKERVVQISLTNSIYWNAHTFALTESGKLYAFGAGDKGQLGVELAANQTERGNPERVDVDLN